MNQILERTVMQRTRRWSHILLLLRPYLAKELLVLVSMAVSSVCAAIPLYLLKDIVDRAFARHDMRVLWVDVAILTGVALAGIAASLFQSALNAHVVQGVMRDIRAALVWRLQAMPIAFFSSTRTGEIINRAINDVESLEGIFGNTIVATVLNAIVVVTTLCLLAAIDWKMTLFAIALLPLSTLVMTRVGREMYGERKRNRRLRDTLSAMLHDVLSFSGMSLMKIFGQERYERTRFVELGTDIMRSEVAVVRMSRGLFSVVTVLTILSTGAIWAVGGFQVVLGTLSVGTLLAFVGLLGRLYVPAAALASVQTQIAGAAAVLERIDEYLAMAPEPDGRPVPDAAFSPPVMGGVRVEHVRFSYEAGRDVLENLDITIPAGSFTALVGPSGSGKTTIANLLVRLYVPRCGRVLLDGADIGDVGTTALRRSVNLITQEAFFFHDTIASNLRYGKSDATLDEMRAATAAVDIGDYIDSLPAGYETTVGERGHHLSGGQRQKLAVARALLRDPAILILDEATSALDPISERIVYSSLLRSRRGRTTIVVAHRLSTVAAADQIVVLDRGRVVDRGVHRDLCLRGLYRDMFEAQTSQSSLKELIGAH